MRALLFLDKARRFDGDAQEALVPSPLGSWCLQQLLTGNGPLSLMVGQGRIHLVALSSTSWGRWSRVRPCCRGLAAADRQASRSLRASPLVPLAVSDPTTVEVPQGEDGEELDSTDEGEDGEELDSTDDETLELEEVEEKTTKELEQEKFQELRRNLSTFRREQQWTD
eukprot:582282-Amphidinium_carterae.1